MNINALEVLAAKARSLFADLPVCDCENIADYWQPVATCFRRTELEIIKEDTLFSMGIRDIVFENQ